MGNCLGFPRQARPKPSTTVTPCRQDNPNEEEKVYECPKPPQQQRPINSDEAARLFGGAVITDKARPKPSTTVTPRCQGNPNEEEKVYEGPKPPQQQRPINSDEAARLFGGAVIIDYGTTTPNKPTV